MFYRRSRPPLLFATLVMTTMSALTAKAQLATDSLEHTRHHWLVTASIGNAAGGPAPDIEKAMIASGFNQTMPGGFWGPSGAQPFSRSGLFESGLPWIIAVHYSAAQPFWLGATLGNTPMGTTYGYRDPNIFLETTYSVFMLAVTIAVRYGEVLQLGIGPAIFIRTPSLQADTGIGALIDASLSIPHNSLFYGMVSFQYRYVGNVVIGPFHSKPGGSSATMDAITANYNHTLIALGFGFRL